MAYYPLTIQGGNPPFSIQIIDAVNNTAIICTQGCDSSLNRTRVLSFTPLVGARAYLLTVTDGSTPACTSTQVISALDCVVALVPAASMTVIAPVCQSGILTTPQLNFTNVINANRWALQLGSTFSGNNCLQSTSFNGSSFTVPLPAMASYSTQNVTVRLWGGDDCSNYVDYNATLISPTCVPPSPCTLTLTVDTPYCG